MTTADFKCGIGAEVIRIDRADGMRFTAHVQYALLRNRISRNKSREDNELNSSCNWKLWVAYISNDMWIANTGSRQSVFDFSSKRNLRFTSIARAPTVCAIQRKCYVTREKTIISLLTPQSASSIVAILKASLCGLQFCTYMLYMYTGCCRRPQLTHPPCFEDKVFLLLSPLICYPLTSWPWGQ